VQLFGFSVLVVEFRLDSLISITEIYVLGEGKQEGERKKEEEKERKREKERERERKCVCMCEKREDGRMENGEEKKNRYRIVSKQSLLEHTKILMA
jgi:hypothetical protein